MYFVLHSGFQQLLQSEFPRTGIKGTHTVTGVRRKEGWCLGDAHGDTVIEWCFFKVDLTYCKVSFLVAMRTWISNSWRLLPLGLLEDYAVGGYSFFGFRFQRQVVQEFTYKQEARQKQILNSRKYGKKVLTEQQLSIAVIAFLWSILHCSKYNGQTWDSQAVLSTRIYLQNFRFKI